MFALADLYFPMGAAFAAFPKSTTATGMHMSSIRTRLPLCELVVAVAFLAGSAGAAAEKLPPWSVVEHTVAEQLASIQNYRDGDLLSQSQAAPIFAQLETHGWVVADGAKILASILPDDDFLVEELRTPAGVKFMRKIAAYPQAYDEIDLLSRLPKGDLMVRDFLRFAHSDRTFNNKQGPSPAMYARLVPDQKRQGVPTPKDFEKPTGRVYTAGQLVARLQQSYRAAELAQP